MHIETDAAAPIHERTSASVRRRLINKGVVYD
jgi:hypothetical protein